jgi:hypothetical protein
MFLTFRSTPFAGTLFSPGRHVMVHDYGTKPYVRKGLVLPTRLTTVGGLHAQRSLVLRVAHSPEVRLR